MKKKHPKENYESITFQIFIMSYHCIHLKSISNFTNTVTFDFIYETHTLLHEFWKLFCTHMIGGVKGTHYFLLVKRWYGTYLFLQYSVYSNIYNLPSISINNTGAVPDKVHLLFLSERVNQSYRKSQLLVVWFPSLDWQYYHSVNNNLVTLAHLERYSSTEDHHHHLHHQLYHFCYLQLLLSWQEQAWGSKTILLLLHVVSQALPLTWLLLPAVMAIQMK